MYIPTSNVEEIVNAIEKLNVPRNKTVLILLAEQELPDITHLISELNKREIDFFGAIFPGLIYGAEKYHTGAIIHFLPVIQRPILIRNISEASTNMENLMQSFKFLSKTNTTALIIIDCMSSSISSFLSSIYNLFADSVEYLGCGAGFLEIEQRPCIFTNDGFFEDAAVVSFIDMQCRIGVHHGWKKALGPIVVTKSEGNSVKELNWKNAFAIYKEAVESSLEKEFNENNFYDISSHCPFGIYTEGHEDLVREVLKAGVDGDLFCAGDVPENAVVNILKGENLALVNAAQEALEDCFLKGELRVNYCVVIDCIGRSLFLQDDFKKELKTIKNGLEARSIDTVPEGVLSLGEIASMDGDALEFLNKTIVIGVFHESTDTAHRDI